MPLSLRESNAIAGLADHLYNFLPGSGNAVWQGHVSFKSVAEKVGVGRYWQKGSKTPMLVALLGSTLTHHRALFEPLILEIVRASIPYRQKQGDPLKPSDIETLNGLLVEVGFKFPDLWDPDFIASLRLDSKERAKGHVAAAAAEQRVRASAFSAKAEHLRTMQQEFFALHAQEDRQAAGLALESILNRLFALEGLAPREPFRVVGEQIDGSFVLDHETYLLEAKWEKAPLCEEPLLVFYGKVGGKSHFTRGLFIAINGITEQAATAIVRGKPPNFFVANGYELTKVLAGHLDLKTFLRHRQRLLAEGQVTAR